MRTPHILLSISLSAALAAGLYAGQTNQAPATPPPQPPAGAANGPTPGPAVKAPGPGDRTGDANPVKPNPDQDRSEAARTFLAIGAPPDPQAVKRGQATFVANCAFCHGSNAHGGNSGPDLVRSVTVLHDKGTGTEITPVIRNGRPAKGMPAFNLPDAQIKDIAAFLLSRNQAAANRMDYKILNVVTGDAKAGETYFTSHCANCHSATGDLSHVAAKFDPVALQSRFLYPFTQDWFGPKTQSDPRAESTVTVTLASGKTVTGVLDHIDDFSVSLTQPSGEHCSWVFDDEKGIQVEVHDPLAKHAELLKQYSNTDMHNILAYLETLK